MAHLVVVVEREDASTGIHMISFCTRCAAYWWWWARIYAENVYALNTTRNQQKTRFISFEIVKFFRFLSQFKWMVRIMSHNFAFKTTIYFDAAIAFRSFPFHPPINGFAECARILIATHQFSFGYIKTPKRNLQNLRLTRHHNRSTLPNIGCG